MKLIDQYMEIFFNLSPTSDHLHPLQEKCDSNSRLVVDDDDNGKFRLERVKIHLNKNVITICSLQLNLTHTNIYIFIVIDN